MAANTAPIYSIGPDIQSSVMMLAVNASLYDIAGTIGTDIYLIYTAPTEGGFVQRIRFKYAGNSTTTSVACIAKVWLTSVNTGTPTIGTQAWFLDEIALPATGALSVTVPAPTYDMPLNFAIPSGKYLCIKLTAAQPASFGWMAMVIGGKY